MTAHDAGNNPAPPVEPHPQIEIATDEDWKNRVKAEDAALDQQFRAKDESGPEKTPGPESTARAGSGAEGRAERTSPPQEFPEASFAALLGMLSTQAMVALGLISNPATQKAERQLPLARYFIDLIAVLEQKTAGQLEPDEAAALDETLHSLRMAYVQRSSSKTGSASKTD